MNYLVVVVNDGIILEKIIFSYRDEAIFFTEKRRKQGYTVHIKTLNAN